MQLPNRQIIGQALFWLILEDWHPTVLRFVVDSNRFALKHAMSFFEN